MKIQELFEDYGWCFSAVSNCKNNVNGFCKSCEQDKERMAEIIQEVEALVRKETIEEIYKGIQIFDYTNKMDHDVKKILEIMIKEGIKKHAQSKGITL